MDKKIIRHFFGNSPNVKIRHASGGYFFVGYQFSDEVFESVSRIRETLQILGLGAPTLQELFVRCAEVALEIEAEAGRQVYPATVPVPAPGEWLSHEAYEAYRCVCHRAKELLDEPERSNFPVAIRFLFQIQNALYPDENAVIQAAFGDETSVFPYGKYYLREAGAPPPQLPSWWLEDTSSSMGTLYRSVGETPAHYFVWATGGRDTGFVSVLIDEQ